MTPDTARNGNLAWNALLIAMATGIGGLIYFGGGKGAFEFGRSLWQRLGGDGNGVGNWSPQRGAGRRGPRKIAVEEPMAGYGA